MTEYKAAVERRRLQIEADEWSKGVRSLHSHQLKSMWYDNRPQDTDNGAVTDVQYNNGVIVRSKKGKEIHRFGKEKKAYELVNSFIRNRSR